MSDRKPPRPSGSPNRGPGKPGARKAASGRPTTGKTPAARKGSGTGASAGGSSRRRRVAKKVAKWTLIVGLLGAVGLAIAVYIGYRMIDIPDPNAEFKAQTSTVYYADGRHVVGQFALQNRESIALDDVPQHVQDAVVGAEDENFWSNDGIDLTGVVRAAWHNLRSDTTQGASTITQQYVKVYYLSQERTWSRKIKEAFIALKVDDQLSKEEILEGYLNTIYYGRGAYGIEAAAQAYFDRGASELSVAQGAVLAAVLNSPGNLDPSVAKENRQRLLDRYRYVLAQMADNGNLDPAKAERLQKQLPKLADVSSGNRFGGQRGYLMELVEKQLVAEGFTQEEIYGGGLQIITTFDWGDMKAAQEAVKKVRPPGKPQLHVALASIEPETGALRAMIGGANYLKGQYNWALNGGQPGSSFKPFALAAGLEDGFTLYDTFDGSSPYVFPDGTEIENQGNQSYGYVNMVTATAHSINTAYIDMTMQMKDGPEKIVRAAHDAGIPDSIEIDPYPAVALGSGVVPTVEMAEGYATFAAEGQHTDWYVIEKVSDSEGTLLKHRAQPERAFSAAITSNITYALEQVVKTGSGTAALALDRPAAGKTGTATSDQDTDGDGANDVSSSWFVGYTPQLATAVMYVRGDGNDALDTGYIDSFYGGDYPADTWTAYMIDALKGEPVLEFPELQTLEGSEPTPTYTPPATTSVAPTTTEPETSEPTTEETTTTSEPTTEEPTTSEPPTTTSAPTTSQTTSQPPTTTKPPPTSTSVPTATADTTATSAPGQQD